MLFLRCLIVIQIDIRWKDIVLGLIPNNNVNLVKNHLFIMIAYSVYVLKTYIIFNRQKQKGYFKMLASYSDIKG